MKNKTHAKSNVSLSLEYCLKIVHTPPSLFLYWEQKQLIQRRYGVTSVLLEKYLPKGVESLQIEIFALKTNKQKSKTKLYNKTSERRYQLMDYFVSSNNAHV